MSQSMQHSNNLHGLMATFGGAAMTVLTYTQIIVSIMAGAFTIAAAIYTMWPGIKSWLQRKGWLK